MATKEIKSEFIGVRVSLEQKTKFKKLAKEKKQEFIHYE